MVETGAPDVLFVCVHNAGRSQMAAALLERLGEGTIRVRSAGTVPADALHPEVVEVMREVGIDLTERRPQRLEDEAVREADVVVTMGCGDACPVYPGKRYEDWDLPDPAGRPLEEVREIRDEIEGRVKQLLTSLSG
jgi:protein-tyrosine-phosphatase